MARPSGRRLPQPAGGAGLGDRARFGRGAPAGRGAPPFWRIRGHLGEGRGWLGRALAAGGGTPAAQAKAQVAAAEICYLQGDNAAGAALAGEARCRYERLGDQRGLAAALRMAGHSYLGLGQEAVPPDQAQFARARAVFEQQLGLRRELGDPHSVALAIFDLGFLALNQGDAAPAPPITSRRRCRFEAAGDRRGAAFTLGSLGRVASRQGDDALGDAVRPGAVRLPGPGGP